ncbi:hypothetical protein Bbelb_237490 [Branchiostoma belcheri]|nr:hypothetical protein Bbelb_237490 [Branchiostoma belcheri]
MLGRVARKRAQLVETLRHISPVLDHLRADDVISLEENDRIRATRTPQDAARELLDILEAKESAGNEHMLTPHMTKQDIKREINTNTHERWQRRYNMSTTSGITHEAVKKVGVRKMGNSKHRTGNILLNQILSGHTRLNEMNYRVNPECTSNTCEHCRKVETIDHYLWECEKYEEQRNVLERDTYLCLEEEGIQHMTAAGRLELYTEGEHRDCGRKTGTAGTEGEECRRDYVEEMSAAVTEGEHRDCDRKTGTAGTEEKSATETVGRTQRLWQEDEYSWNRGEECRRDCVEKRSTALTEGEHRDCGRKTSTEGEE